MKFENVCLGLSLINCVLIYLMNKHVNEPYMVNDKSSFR